MLKLRNAVRIIDIIKQSSANALKDVCIGDVLLLETNIEDKSGASNGIYATYINITNLHTKHKGYLSMTQFAKLFLGNYKYEEVKLK